MNLRELRKEKGWSQGDLSELTGLSVRTVHRIENGHVTPSVESAKALAAVFDRPFADFLPLEEKPSSLGQNEKEQQANNANSSPERVTAPAVSWLGWVPYIAASFVAVSAYFINDLYSQIGQLSGEYSHFAPSQALTPDSGVNWSDPYAQVRAGMAGAVGVIDQFTRYYGDQPIPSLLGVPEGVTPKNSSVSLLEVSALGFIAKILSTSEGEPQRNSDVTVEFILDDFLSCYSSQRKAINEAFENENFDNMFSCIDEITSTKGWALADQQSIALNNLLSSVKEMGKKIERSNVRRMLGGSN